MKMPRKPRVLAVLASLAVCVIVELSAAEAKAQYVVAPGAVYLPARPGIVRREIRREVRQGYLPYYAAPVPSVGVVSAPTMIAPTYRVDTGLAPAAYTVTRPAVVSSSPLLPTTYLQPSVVVPRVYAPAPVVLGRSYYRPAPLLMSPAYTGVPVYSFP